MFWLPLPEKNSPRKRYAYLRDHYVDFAFKNILSSSSRKKKAYLEGGRDFPVLQWNIKNNMIL